MYRVGIIGSENSHANAFSKCFNLSGEYDDVKVIGIWGEEPEAGKKLSEECSIPIMTPEEMLGQVDGIMVTSRNGKLHPGYVRPFIEAGIPAFIDKPFANDYAEAEAIAELAERKNVPIIGGSSLKFAAPTLELKKFADEAKAQNALYSGQVFAPVNLVNPYGDFYFYSSHLVEIALTVFGFDPVAVTAVKVEKGVAVILEYASFAVTLSYNDHVFRYGGTVVAAEETLSIPITDPDAYRKEADHFVKMLKTGEVPQSNHDLIFPVRVLNAIEESYTRLTRVLL